MIIVSWTLHNLVAHHLRTLPTISTNIDMVFGKLEINDFGASADSQDVGLKVAIKSLRDELKKLKLILWMYWVAIWAVIPVFVVLFCHIGETAPDQASELLNHMQSDSSQ